MKLIIKYITLLACSGVMLPLYRLHTPVLTDDKPPVSVVSAIDNPIKYGGDFHFSITHDVVAELLPVINFLN